MAWTWTRSGEKRHRVSPLRDSRSSVAGSNAQDVARRCPFQGCGCDGSLPLPPANATVRNPTRLRVSAGIEAGCRGRTTPDGWSVARRQSVAAALASHRNQSCIFARVRNGLTGPPARRASRSHSQWQTSLGPDTDIVRVSDDCAPVAPWRCPDATLPTRSSDRRDAAQQRRLGQTLVYTSIGLARARRLRTGRYS